MRSILEKATAHCKHLLETTRCKSLPYHNWTHTLDVYRKAERICRLSDIPLQTMEPVLLAALFHDTGNAYSFRGHEALSAGIATEFLEEHYYPPDRRRLVSSCILATKLPQQPEGHLEEILCDADLFHLGSPSFFEKLRLLRKEWAEFLDQNYSQAEWYQLNIEFLRSHTYHTAYGRKVLAPLKKRNMEILEWSVSKLQKV